MLRSPDVFINMIPKLLENCIIMQNSNLRSDQQDLKQKLRDRDRDRWMWQLPRQVMDKIGVQPGMDVADVGAGDGYFSIYLAKRVGKTGKESSCLSSGMRTKCWSNIQDWDLISSLSFPSGTNEG
jgi:predicted methyltransferase